jgi:hypothetical protein
LSQKSIQHGTHIRKKLDARQMEGFVNAEKKVHGFPSVYPLDFPAMRLG